MAKDINQISEITWCKYFQDTGQRLDAELVHQILATAAKFLVGRLTPHDTTNNMDTYSINSFIFGPVSAWVCHHLWTGKPSRNRTWPPGPLSLSSHLLWVGWNDYLVKAGGVNRHITWYISPYPCSCSVVLLPGGSPSLDR